MRKKLAAIVLLCASLCLHCGKSTNNQANQPLLSIEGSYPARVGEVTSSGKALGGYFRINETADPRSLDPIRTGETSAHHIATQIYDGLFEFDADLNVIPCLAESYTVSEDRKTFTFTLHKGVRFHDNECFPDGKGREMNANDVLYSYTRVVDPKLPSTGPWIFSSVEGVEAFRNGTVDHVSGFEVVDDYTFVIRLKEPFAPFLMRLAMSYGFIIPHEAVEHYGEDFFQHPVGTGAFQFVYYKPDQEILMVRNPHYWQTDEDGIQLPYLDGVRFLLIKDFKTEFLEFDVGNMDHVQRIHEDIWLRLFDENGKVKPEYEHYQVQSKVMMITQFYGFSLTKAPFKDNKALRQAINYAIDRDSICKFVMKGRGVPAVGFMPLGMPGYHSIAVENLESLPFVDLFDQEKILNEESRYMPYHYDPEKAKALLAEAGYPNGEGLDEIVLQLNSGGTLNEGLAEAIQSQLREINIPVRLEIVEWSQHLENLDYDRSQFFRLGWNADYPDPENFLALFWTKNFAPGGPNYTRFSNPEFDRLFEEALTTLDFDTRVELYHQAEKVVLEEAPVLFISHDRLTKLNQPFVRGFVVNAMDVPILKHVWLEQ